jgi:CRP-like cAMP-binding protein
MEREKQLEEMAFKSVPARLAALLLGLADETGEVSGYSHQALAELLGVYRETVTSTLDAFKARGAIEIGRKRIRLVDRKALAAIADSP